MNELARREPEIDGLRSFAIIPVVLYHAGWTALPGGFVGVDVFFVISGYLITRILDREMSAGGFSLWRFYERRARRIGPALLLVLAVCTLATLALYLPTDLVTYGQSLLYALFFASNVYFFQHTGYFDPAATSNPLLHTWSLAVEEQFYLVFPLLLFAAALLIGKHRKWVFLILAVASLALSITVSASSSKFAFYLPFTRAWELLVGSLLALNLFPPLTNRVLREIIAAISLLAIVATVVLLREGGAFPGWVALIPVLGAGGILYCSPGTLVGRLLSLPVLVGTGLVSYSLYLWHWPLLVVGSYLLIRPLTLLESSALAVVALALSIVTWRFVEQPFRNRSFLTRSTIFGLTGAGLAVGAMACATIVYTGGLPGRIPPEARILDASAADISPERPRCNGVALKRLCALGADVEPRVAVWSDSHGVELSYALGEVAAKMNASILEITTPACPPAIGLAKGKRHKCLTRNAGILDYITRHPNLRTIIMVASTPGLGYAKSFEKAVAAVQKLGRQIVLEYPTPRRNLRDMSVPSRLARQQWHSGIFEPVMATREQYDAMFGDLTDLIDNLAKRYGARVTDPRIAFCDDKVCYAYRNGHVMLFDGHHPTVSAERMNAVQYTDIILAAAPSSP